MEFFALIISGWMIGLIAAIPIGPVNLICIRRTLQCGWRYGFVSGLGAALGDGLFASVTGFGLTAIAQLIEGYSTILQIVGGVFLLGIGIRTFTAPPPLRLGETYGPFQEGVAACNGKNGKNGQNNGPTSKARGMASTFALTITNPATLFFFTAWFASLGGLADNPSFFAAARVVLGVFLGSATWWLLLTGFVGKLHARINDRVVRRINEASGALVALFGMAVLLHVAYEHLFR
jgi:threonine/homoserine/homoserine lactone efflux protein